MDELTGILIILVIGILAAGPVAFIMTLVLFNRVGRLEQKIHGLMTGRQTETPPGYQPVAPPKPVIPTSAPAVSVATVTTEPKTSPAATESYWPVKTAERPSVIEEKSVPVPPKPVVPVVPHEPVPTVSKVPLPLPTVKPVIEKLKIPRVGLEQMIGTIVALVAGVITVIVGVAFFLKYIYVNAYFGPTARVCIVAAGGAAALIIGELTRRRSYEIVAKGVSAMGFVLLYTAVFSASRVYMLIDTSAAFMLAIAITAGAMTYAVVLNEVIIAFLSLLGGYLSPWVISSGQNLAIPLFSYLLALAVGAVGCAMFRRWRAVNWIAMVGTYLLYTGWFEKFYTSGQMTLTLTWLGVFGVLFLVQPILYGLVRKVAARSEDVGLVVANSAAVFYYLWRILYAEHQQAQALAAAIVGLVHLALLGVVLVRCREDRKLQAALGVLGTALVTTAIPLYFSALNPTLLSWSVEAVALTFIGIRYRSLWTKAMAFVVGAIAAVGLFYHLPLHGAEAFRIVYNAPFGTWVFVCAALLVCHAMWRCMSEAQDEEGRFTTQAYYAAGVLLTALGCTLEWMTYCDRSIENRQEGQAALLLGIMVIAAVLMAALLARPLSPKGGLVRTVGMLTAFFGSIFTLIAMMNVYYDAFRLFANRPFAIACGYAAVILLAAWWMRRTADDAPYKKQVVAGMGLLALAVVFVLLAEQGYWYWYCRNEYIQPIAQWQASAVHTVAISWAVYGILLLAAGLGYGRIWLHRLATLIAIASAFILLTSIPLHTNGTFRFMANLPFTAWIIVAAMLLAGQGLWRLVKIPCRAEGRIMAQVYYAVGILLGAAGWAMEWDAHCRWHVTGPAGDANFLLGVILLMAFLVIMFLLRPLPPAGVLVRSLGVLAGLLGAVVVVYAMADVHTAAFTVFFNLPFAIAVVFVAAMLTGAWLVYRAATADPQWTSVSSALLLAGLTLVWILLSQEVYYFWSCRNTFAGPVEDWRFSAQMYMSVTWAVYGAVLVVGGFVFRARGVRYLSLILFAVLLGKIFLKDTITLRIEYRIAAFLTTGLILVGVSFVYQFLKKKGFFEDGNKVSDIQNQEMQKCGD
jgi:uncharacterized membrane protein